MINPYDFIEQMWQTERDPISFGYDMALDLLCTILPFTVHKYRSGTKCWGWTIPEAWKCYKAYIKDSRGNEIINVNEHPMRVVRYSKKINKWVDFNELKDHIYFDINSKDAIPYVSKPFSDDEWGFCMTFQEISSFDPQEKYYVYIDTEFRNSELRIAEYNIEGEVTDTILFNAHLDGVHQADYGLSGIAIMLLLIENLKQIKKPHFSYKFIIAPNLIGPIAYTYHNKSKLDNINCIAGINLDFLGTDQELFAEKTKYETWDIDEILEELHRSDSTLKLYGYGESESNTLSKHSVNDSYVYSSAGIDIPTVSIFRYPYKGCLSNQDHLGKISEISLEESSDIIQNIVEIFETNKMLKPTNYGPIYIPPNKLDLNCVAGDFDVNMFSSLYDGETILYVAEQMGLEYDTLLEIVKIFEHLGLIETVWSYNLD